MWFMVLVAMVVVQPPAQVRVGAISVTFLNEDGEQQPSYSEGDTVIYLCRATSPAGSPYTSARLYDKTTRQEVARDDQVYVSEDETGGHTISSAQLRQVPDSNAVEYRVTIENIDRYDAGNRYYCEFYQADGTSSGAGGVSVELKVNWEPPAVQCDPVPDQVTEESALVPYTCSVVDADVKSTGNLTLWKNGEEVAAASGQGASPATPRGSQYEISHEATLSDVNDAFVCRYRGTGGLKEYAANCTFNRPSCVAGLADAPCPANGARASRGPVGFAAVLAAVTAWAVFGVDG